MKKFLQMLALTLFAATLAACGSGDEKEIKANTESAIRAVIDGDADKMVKVFYLDGVKPTDADMAKMRPMMQMISAAMKEQIEKQGGLKSIDVSDVKVDGNNATAKVTLTTGTGKSDSQTTKLTKVDGEWKVLMR